MCGIIAYKGEENATAIAIQGLKNLEYRGYDSWGLVYFDGWETRLLKKVGKIGEFHGEDKLAPSAAAVGHTRWATHGGVTEINAHPHFSCDRRIFVVHNGIVENYAELRQELEKKGHRFISQTDTEVIPHLIEEYKKNNSFVVAAEKTFRRLRGFFAVVVWDRDSGEIIGMRRGSPLVMGVGETGLFLASDIPAFLEKTNRVILLDDGDLVHMISAQKYQIKNLISGKKLKKKIITVNWSKEEAEKGKHPHFMIKEIKEIPDTMVKTAWQDKKAWQQAVSLVKKSPRLHFVACGTAGHACLAGKYLWAGEGKQVDFSPASEFRHFLPALDRKTLLIAVSQSGETIDVIDAVQAAQARGIKVLSLVNVMGSTLTRLSDYVLMLNAGPEKCVLATKSYLSQISLLALLFYASQNRWPEAKKALEKTSRGIDRLLRDSVFTARVKKLAKSLASAEHIFTIGRGYHYPTALETALKMKEGCYIHTEAFAGGELKHGVIALIEKGTPCLVHWSADAEEENTMINAMELKSRGARLIGIGPEIKKDFDFCLKTSAAEGIFAALANIVPVHLLSYYIALEKKINPDQPRNLAKSVTVK